MQWYIYMYTYIKDDQPGGVRGMTTLFRRVRVQCWGCAQAFSLAALQQRHQSCMKRKIIEYTPLMAARSMATNSVTLNADNTFRFCNKWTFTLFQAPRMISTQNMGESYFWYLACFAPMLNRIRIAFPFRSILIAPFLSSAPCRLRHPFFFLLPVFWKKRAKIVSSPKHGP